MAATRAKVALLVQGIPQRAAAQLVGVGEAYISRIVSGSKEPSPVVREKLAALLRMDPATLFEPVDADEDPAEAVRRGRVAQGLPAGIEDTEALRRTARVIERAAAHEFDDDNRGQRP